ncbi:MAG: PD-(D/E)XK nuclease family protein [Defluviitaleaceae bacterium]|nr:PD-(D/E)XK nuclease family protein [Defluviitaleaceae bacterium]
MKDDKTISASEINRYLFCNYQWYYERKYGLTELRRRKKEHLEEMGITPDENSPIMRGLAFHARFGRWRWLKVAYKWLRTIALIAAFIFFLLFFGIVVI